MNVIKYCTVPSNIQLSIEQVCIHTLVKFPISQQVSTYLSIISKYKHLTLSPLLSSIVLGLGPTLMYFSVQYYNYLLRSVGPIIKVEYEEVKV